MDERKEDYYLNGIDKQGRWAGGLAARFGLQGSPVKRAEFRNVLDGFSPDGQRALVQNAGKTKRDACWDMTFSVPKEVAVLWALSPPATRRLIEQEVQESVQAVLTKAQEVGGISRSGPGGKIKERAELMWATFFEGTSRAQDPQPHVHAVLVNLGRRQDGTFGALYTPNLFRWKMPLGAMFQADLASRLTRRFGVRIEARQVGFGIRGVPQDLCRHFSKRRQVIEQTMRERGVAGAIEAKTAAKDTRPRKEEVPADRLFAHWQKTGLSFGWKPEQVMNLSQGERAKPITVEQFGQRVRQIVQETPPKQQTRSHLVRASARAAFEQGVDGETLFQSFKQLRMSDGQRVLWQPRWQDRAMAQEAAPKAQDLRRVPGHSIEQRDKARGRRLGRTAVKKVASKTPRTPHAEKAQADTPKAPPREPAHEGVRFDHVRAESPQDHSAQSPAGGGSSHEPRPLTPSLSPARSGGEGLPAALRLTQAGVPLASGGSESEGGRTGEGERSMLPEQVRKEQVALQLPSPLAQVDGGQGRAGSNDRRAGDAKRTRRVNRQKRPAAENARTEGRKEAAHDRAEAKHGSSAKRRKFIHLRWKALYDKRPWVPEQKQLVHVHWKQPFRRALWGRLRNVQVPTIGIELPRLGLGAPKPFVPRWWSIRWKKNLVIGELRIQDRVLFRKAPKWSPLHGLTLPALRFTLQKSKWTSMKAPPKSRRPSKQEGKSKDHGHAH